MASVVSFAEAAKAAAAAAKVSKKSPSPQNSAAPSPPGVPVLPPPPQVPAMPVRMADAVAAAQAAAKSKGHKHHARPTNHHHKAHKNSSPNFGPGPLACSVTPPPLYSAPTVPVEPVVRRSPSENVSQKSAGSSPKTPPGPQAPPAVSLREAAKGAKQQMKVKREQEQAQQQQSQTIQTLLAQQQQLIAQRQMLLAAQHQGLMPMMPVTPVTPVTPMTNGSAFPTTALATPPGPTILNSPAMPMATPSSGSQSPHVESSGAITAEEDDDVPELVTVPEEWEEDAPALIDDECPPELLPPVEAWVHTRGSPVPPRFPTDDWEGGGAPAAATSITLRRC